MRDNYEHFDERLGRWWRESKNHNLADMNIAPRKDIRGLEEIERMRTFDPATGDLTMWGDDCNLNELINEIKRIRAIVTQESAKPHWEEHQKQP